MDPVDRVELYWRPGCLFCARLERALDKANVPIIKHNIWENADAAAFVRSVAGGDETVPTVAVGTVTLVNPGVREVTKVLETEAPHLLHPQ